MHKKLGNDVLVVTGTIVDRAGMDKYVKPSGRYFMKNSIEIIRLPPLKLPYFMQKKLHIHRHVYKTLVDEKPDLIFIHEVNSLSILQVKKYVKKNPKVRVMIDNHNDYFNSGRNELSMNILHKGLYRWICKQIYPLVEVFWGTLPIRSEFLHQVYGVSYDKIRFLPMGIDDTDIPYGDKQEIKKHIRNLLNIEKDDFVVITGGKIDEEKRILELVRAVKKLPDKIKLIIFGKPTNRFQMVFNEECANSKQIIYVGWIDSKNVYKYFFSADLACFPGGHSVLWEQAVACGIPAVFRKRKGMDHVDIGGNCTFIDNADVNTIENSIMSLYNNTKCYEKMKAVAEKNGRPIFSYLEIARKSINDRN
ncbi:glycosyltransferase family 4 protein [Lachnoclostridium pacaense]|uniref:glycosyltransferase family 4 protein n=1 Tax=Enterocloster hominis (ex Hitch et al. 2024) TaxID=1917870 RepID=UPI001D108014|nr:glycosyltransferase family 4 protein [Lachnoclostridium pacaense]MCC2820947.1 glycosyltransferase family 4 protein [Lachnoclostridium pacaense]